MFFFFKYPLESKYQLLINGREKLEIKELKNTKLFIDYSQFIIEDDNPTQKRKMLIVFDDMIAHMEANKNSSLILTELFLKGRKLNISPVFISQSYSKVPETRRINVTHYFIKAISNKREL